MLDALESPEAPDHGGLFVVLEGGDGSGKSTQVGELVRWLREQGHDVVATREPGGTPAGRSIREVLLHGGDLAPRAEALLYAADRAHHVASVVTPALEAGRVVVSDRYVDSTLAYQGGGRGLAVRDLSAISAWAAGGLLPDLTVVLDVDPATALARTDRLRDAPDRLEREPVAFHAAVRQRFVDLAAAAPARYAVVDASAGADEVAQRVRAAVAPLLTGRAVGANLAPARSAEATSGPWPDAGGRA